MIGFNFVKGEITIPGSGSAPVSWTSTIEIAQFIVHVLINLPREKLEWKIFRIEGERAVSSISSASGSICLLTDFLEPKRDH